MKTLVYQVAATLDGFIAGPNGEYDWIPDDPTIDFSGLFARFDTAVMGRLTFETMLKSGGTGAVEGLRTIVFSRTLKAADHPAVEITNRDPVAVVRELKAERGSAKGIWLFGGGALFRTLADAGLVDVVELALCPVLLGGGIPIFPPGKPMLGLQLQGLEQHPSGIIIASYNAANR